MLLDYAKPDAIKKFVGKRAGLHHYQQFTINKLIVKYAYRYGTVVRLKGGDPYVFGRGHEEAVYATRQGLEVTLIPGISSALAVPALQGIPLTKRGICQSFCVVTATDKKGNLGRDIQWAAKGSGTVVILMGMKKLSLIVQLFQKCRSPAEPAAIIQNGTCKNERFCGGTLDNIVEKVKENELASPAVIIIGPVVKEKEKMTNIYLPGDTINLRESLFL